MSESITPRGLQSDLRCSLSLQAYHPELTNVKDKLSKELRGINKRILAADCIADEGLKVTHNQMRIERV